MNKNKFLKNTQILLILLLISVSAYLSYGDLTDSGICLPSGQTECSSVRNSVYGTIFGIKLSYFGLAAFIFLALLYVGARIEHAKRKTVHSIFAFVSAIGALFAAYFLYLQFFVLKKICVSCFIIDGIMIVAFVFSLIDFILELKNKTS